MVIDKEKISRRALSKQRRQLQLLDATIKCISKKGLGSMTLADVASEAGLSQGIVNLHFKSKDNLLKETLIYLFEDYDAQFMHTVANSPPQATAKVLALMEMDVSPAVCDRQKLAVWFAFWGEAKAVPTYRRICAAYEHKYDEIMLELAESIIREGDYADIDAQTVTDVLTSMTDGLWLACLIHPKTFDREAAMKSIYSYLHAIFPEHYPAERDT
jgi:AcrR family transcriptional regulator